ncbi:hypothetical protein M011DRAFT_121301 [Sporormia fimetaria CBS 119925]|uniref:Rhodopsin domain-containing protein n=1 Tax=Sporormia fimetaria CBS 119925 TaxID=1340428 RepID=A0A6A6V920_9PLEO|nr:hypothetical protein M011DRAFT_121301 [Sporormia fimetaria CBS 119925]
MAIVPIAGIEAVAWTSTSICVLLTIGRLAIRWRILHKLRTDDIFNAFAAILVIPFVVLCHLALPIENRAHLYFLGQNNEPLTMAEIKFMNDMEVGQLLLFWLIIYSVKASVLALYWQIFAISDWFRLLWWGTTIYIAVSFGATFLSVFWRCGAPSNVVDLDACMVAPDSLGRTLVLMWCILNVMGGLLLLLLPLIMVSRLLALPQSAKWGLTFIFSLVLIDIAFDIVRTVYALVDSLSVGSNLTAIWTIMEPTIAVTVCALPVYKALLCRNSPLRSTEASNRSFSRTKRSQNTTVPEEMELGRRLSLPSQSSERGDVEEIRQDFLYTTR